MTLDRNTLDATIDRYLAGEMTEAERSAFQNMLAQDPETAELLAADNIISSVSRTSFIANTPNILPSASLLQYLSQTRPQRRWAAYFVTAGFALFLAGILCLQASNMDVNTVPTEPAAQQPVAVSHHQDVHATTPINVEPSTKNIQSASPASISLSTIPATPKIKTHPSLDEPSSKPRIFTSDSASMKIHTK